MRRFICGSPDSAAQPRLYLACIAGFKSSKVSKQITHKERQPHEEADYATGARELQFTCSATRDLFVLICSNPAPITKGRSLGLKE